MDETEWSSGWLRAVLPLVSLSILARGEAHGYVILRTLGSLGFGSVKGGTLYPFLARQQELGLVDHRWEIDSPGPARKVFWLTDRGRREFERLASEWRRLNTTVASALSHPTSEMEKK
ncbi:PadR family transcriptional regulator [Micromonospora inaquosa]|uniref:PadR family transcriptional regulator n=1 Tax=Micromonospora inaquosa TaxID=2203716 RepID=A0A3N9WXX9_9ACTN|nr:PadR family transcriptional regulator [Micromonospora inaquosa]RQX05602.1 PadR family transcriptional regulator [Micromonospora inaquosa]